jgi:chromosome segregation ATPase
MHPLIIGYNEAFINAGIPVPTIKSQTANKTKIVPLSSYLLGGAAIIGLIAAVAGSALASTPWVIGGTCVFIVASYGAWEIRNLALSVTSEDQLEFCKTYVIAALEALENLKKEKSSIETHVTELEEEIDNFQDAKNEIHRLNDCLGEASKQLEQMSLEVQEQHIKKVKLKNEFKQEINDLKTANEDISSSLVNAKTLAESTKQENDELQKNVKELHISNTELQKKIETLNDESIKMITIINEKNDLLSSLQQDLTLSTKEKDEFKADYELLNEARDVYENAVSQLKVQLENQKLKNKQLKALNPDYKKLLGNLQNPQSIETPSADTDNYSLFSSWSILGK